MWCISLFLSSRIIVYRYNVYFNLIIVPIKQTHAKLFRSIIATLFRKVWQRTGRIRIFFPSIIGAHFRYAFTVVIFVLFAFLALSTRGASGGVKFITAIRKQFLVKNYLKENNQKRHHLHLLGAITLKKLHVKFQPLSLQMF